MIAVKVLGPLDASVGGAPADLGGPRQRSVLARLVAEDGRVVPLDRLIEDVYAGEVPPRALAAVQSFVSHLRRALEPDRQVRTPARVLVTSPPGYALRLERDAVDAWRFEDALHSSAGPGEPARVHAELTESLGLWRGRAYQEFAGMQWADLEATRLEELRLSMLERRAAAALQLGLTAQAVPELESLATEHPLREELWRLLALALYRCGRQGDALAALRRARARLADELGIDPGPALHNLEADILAQAPHLLDAPAATPSSRPAAPGPADGRPAAPPHPVPVAGRPAATIPAPAARDVYVGRERELARIAHLAAESAHTRMRIALVSGDAGAGKTALTDRVRQDLAGEGWTVTAGRCPEHDGAPAGWPWAELLRQLAAVIPPADPEPLAPLLTDAGSAGGDVPAGRLELHRAVAGYLGAVARDTPLLLVLDDLHRADAETLAALTDVAGDLTTSRVLVLATYRHTEVGEWLADCLAMLARHEPDRIALGGLDPASAAELVRATCHRPVADEVVDTIAARTDGNPFFIRETARLLDAEGELVATSEVPAGVRDVLLRRIARLPATAQTVLREAAVIGRETDADVLVQVARTGEDVVLDALEAGLLTGLLTEPDTGRVRFVHALVRDTLYDGLSRLRRSRLHARAAAAIEQHRPGDVAALAHHFVAAGADPAKAARYCRLAAAQAEGRFAYHEAARLWEQAIACLDQTGAPAPQDRLELVLSLVRALSHTGRLAQARSWRRDAVLAALPLGDPLLLARVITSFDVPVLWSVQEYGSIDAEMVEAAERALRELPAGEDRLRCRLLTSIAFELEGERTERGQQAAEEAVVLARSLGDPEVLTIALNASYIRSYNQVFHRGGAEGRLHVGAELLTLSGRSVTAEALGHLVLMQANCGLADFAAADHHAAEADRIAQRYGLPSAATRVAFYRALRLALSGDTPAAEEAYQRAAEQMNRLGMWQHGAGLATLGRLCMRIVDGRAAESAAELEQFYRYPKWSAIFADMYALTLAASGRMEEAREVAANPRPVRPDFFWLLQTGVRGLLGIAIGDRARAESAYRALLPHAEIPIGGDLGVVSLWPTAQLLGDLARYLGLPAAEEHYRQALAVAERAGVEWWAKAARARL